tara:strand:- start:7713 stop:8765 length:1053 start_codon:yes stop_codon:yes gene_type:complete
MATNLVNATRVFVNKAWKSHISYGMPLLTRLMERQQIFPGGLQYEMIGEVADTESLVQEYGPNDPLVGGSKEILEKPKWNRAYITIPVEKTVDEDVINAPEGDGKLIDTAEVIAKNALRSMKQLMYKRIYGSANDAEIDTYHTYLQGLCSALDTDKTYGGLTRATSVTNEWWQAADYAAHDTAATISKSNLWNWLDSVREFTEGSDDILIIMGSTLYNRMKAQMEASNSYEVSGNAAKQGFRSMSLDGYEIAEDLRLERLTGADVEHRDGSDAGLDGTTADVGSTYVFVLNLNTWSLRYTDRAGSPFDMSDFFDQDKLIGGLEKSLARIKWKGNLICEQPNANLMRTAIT